ncbi:sericin-2-like, partial [Littorina saxatilis]|uniref:sericin-2-like n=1 Tax=Littorina saxatilis TaxID=31220 RepID=UPI0038B57EDF
MGDTVAHTANAPEDEEIDTAKKKGSKKRTKNEILAEKSKSQNKEALSKEDNATPLDNEAIKTEAPGDDNEGPPNTNGSVSASEDQDPDVSTTTENNTSTEVTMSVENDASTENVASIGDDASNENIASMENDVTGENGTSLENDDDGDDDDDDGGGGSTENDGSCDNITSISENDASPMNDISIENALSQQNDSEEQAGTPEKTAAPLQTDTSKENDEESIDKRSTTGASISAQVPTDLGSDEKNDPPSSQNGVVTAAVTPSQDKATMTGSVKDQSTAPGTKRASRSSVDLGLPPSAST